MIVRRITNARISYHLSIIFDFKTNKFDSFSLIYYTIEEIIPTIHSTM